MPMPCRFLKRSTIWIVSTSGMEHPETLASMDLLAEPIRKRVNTRRRFHCCKMRLRGLRNKLGEDHEDTKLA